MTEPTRVTESIDGAVMEEIGSPEEDGEEVEFIDEPDITYVVDGEIDRPEEEEVEEVEEEEVETAEGEEEVSEAKPEPSEPDEVETIEEVSEQDDSEASPAEEQPVTSDEEAQVVTEEGASPTESEAEPFTLRVDGQEYDVPGSRIEGDEIVIPRESFQRVIQPRVADRSVWQQERAELQQRIEDLDPAKNPTVVKANTMLEQLLEVLEDEEKAYDFFNDFSKNREKLILEAERAELEAEKNRITTREERERTQERAEELASQMDTALDTVLEEARELEAYSGVDFDYVRSIIEPTKESFFFRADQDYPDYGLEEGDIGIRIDRIEQIIATEAERAKRRREAESARKRNDASIGDRTDSEDSTTPAPPEPTTPVEAEEPSSEPQSREEWEANLARVAAGR